MAIVMKTTPHGPRYMAPNGNTVRWVVRREDAVNFPPSKAKTLAKQYKAKTAS